MATRLGILVALPEDFAIATILRFLYVSTGTDFKAWIYSYGKRIREFIDRLLRFSRIPIPILRSRSEILTRECEFMNILENIIRSGKRILLVSNRDGVHVEELQCFDSIYIAVVDEDFSRRIENLGKDKVVKVKVLGLPQLHYEAIAVLYGYTNYVCASKVSTGVELRRKVNDPKILKKLLYIGRKALEIVTYFDNIEVVSGKSMSYVLNKALRDLGLRIECRHEFIELNFIDGNHRQNLVFDVYDLRSLSYLCTISVTFSNRVLELEIPLDKQCKQKERYTIVLDPARQRVCVYDVCLGTSIEPENVIEGTTSWSLSF